MSDFDTQTSLITEDYHDLDPKWTRPRIAVLDDRRQEVEALISHLERLYVTDWFGDFAGLQKALKHQTYPIQLIDIQLGEGQASGFEVARILAVHSRGTSYLHQQALAPDIDRTNH